MKFNLSNFVLFLALTLLFPDVLFSQTENRILKTPAIDANLEINNIEHIEIDPLSKKMIEDDQKHHEKDGTMLPAGRLLPLNIGMDSAGSWTILEDGTRVWRLRLSSEGAGSSVLHFNEFFLPKGAQVFIYNTKEKLVFGPYTHEDNPDGDNYAIGVMPYGDFIIEYSAPKEISQNEPQIIIRAYSYVYRDPYGKDLIQTKEYGTSDDCEVNINCSEGDDWRMEQKGAARIYVVEGYFGGWCSGSLINNLNSDGIPYFLTAYHCGGNASASEFREWIFDFNYESPTCIDTIEPIAKSITGSKRISWGSDDGGSDFLLLELDITPKRVKELDLVYNGWTKSDTASLEGVGIHHPNGDIMKISTYTEPVVSDTYEDRQGDCAANAHWRLTWSETENGHGVTEGGSSGSPLFNENHLIVGTLTGGESYCTKLSGEDLYGKMSYHWESNGPSDENQLKKWLDPKNTGAETCTMFVPMNALIPVAAIDVSSRDVMVGDTVYFEDVSIQNIDSREWQIEGARPKIGNTEKMVVVFDEVGVYDVVLSVENQFGADTLEIKDYITVRPKLNVSNNDIKDEFFKIYPNPVKDILNVNSAVEAEMYIYSTHGQELIRMNLSQGNNEVSVERLKSGTYILKIIVDSQILVKKIIKL